MKLNYKDWYMKWQKSDYIFWGMVFVAFYFLNRLSISIGDDYKYCFLYDDILDCYRRINSFNDALISQVYDYFSHNGRLIVHTIVSYFCGVLGMMLFQIVNSIVFVLLCIGVVKLIRDEFGYLKNDKYIVVFGVFVLLPSPGTILLGSIAMCINYLWVACATIYFILFYRSIVRGSVGNGIFVKVCCFIIALLYGSLQESFTVGVTFALLLYYCFYINKLRGNIIWLLLGLILGTSIVVLAPGNFVRLDEVNSNGDYGLWKNISNVIVAVLHTKTFILMLMFSFLSFYKDNRKIKKFLSENIVYYIIILANFGITFFAYSGERQLTSIELFSLILLLKLLFLFYRKCLDFKILNLSICFILCLIYVPIYKYRLMYYNSINKLHESSIERNVIVCPEYIRNLRILNSNFLSKNYTYTLDFCEKWMYKRFSCYITEGKDLYRLKAVLMSNIDDIINKYEKRSFDGVYYDKESNYYVVKGNINADSVTVKEKYLPSTIWGTLKNSICGNDVAGSRTLNLFIHFDNDSDRYFIFYENPNYKTINISL